MFCYQWEQCSTVFITMTFFIKLSQLLYFGQGKVTQLFLLRIFKSGISPWSKWCEDLSRDSRSYLGIFCLFLNQRYNFFQHSILQDENSNQFQITGLVGPEAAEFKAGFSTFHQHCVSLVFLGPPQDLWPNCAALLGGKASCWEARQGAELRSLSALSPRD